MIGFDLGLGMICKCKHLIRGLLSRRPSALSGFV